MEIKVNKKIYNRESVKKTIQAYESLVHMDFLEEPDFFIIKMGDVNDDLKDIIEDEFCNYLLFERGKCL